ncbi:uncharacterized protein LOC133185852 [Saccostrea echinata]|uniref:uncharacterized protein LOC133185852 n=1 Tax=Saccostrea echinata TaxID=191078 RepID=UPI002A834933|nr:uncharacterized protein LOC133185852 [Saccostrea echinata]
MEKESSLDRITLALSKLKTELMEMRSQDVKLMKQLITINTTIGSMANARHRNPVLRSASFGSLKRRSMERITNKNRPGEVMCSLRNPLVRHRSAPIMVEDRKDEQNSDMGSLEDVGASRSSDSENDLASLCSSASSLVSSNQPSPPPYLRPLPEEEDTDEKMYYGILMKNIKLWKYSQESINSSESDSSFDS